MTKVTYTIKGYDGKTYKASTYAECLSICNSLVKGATWSVTYEPMTPPEEKKLPLLPKQASARKAVMV